MKKKHIILILFCLLTSAIYSQTEINTTTENAKAEFRVVSPLNNKGVLIPQTTDATTIASPVDGLLVYNTANNTFYYYNGSVSAWQRIGNLCTVLEDNNGDTYIEVDLGGTNENKMHYYAHGVEVVKQDNTGLVQNVGDLNIKTAGKTLWIGTAYGLPTVDGANKYVLVMDNTSSTKTSWKDPLTLPGLVAGLQTMPLGVGREYEPLADKIYLTVLIPWSNITINTISTYIKINSSVGSQIQIGIYDDTDVLLSSGTVATTPTADGLVSVTLAAAVQMKAGKMYRVGVTDKNQTNIQVLEYPTPTNPLNYQKSAVPIHVGLTTPLVGYSTGNKSFWFCLY